MFEEINKIKKEYLKMGKGGNFATEVAKYEYVINKQIREEMKQEAILKKRGKKRKTRANDMVFSEKAQALVIR